MQKMQLMFFGTNQTCNKSYYNVVGFVADMWFYVKE